MDIVSRLKFFLENKHISNSVFADKCKIARPTLSQLLSGRNKKVSDEIISKIHESYPSLSILWLLFGEGNMELFPTEALPLENAISEITDGNNSNTEISDGLASAQNSSPVIDFDYENFESDQDSKQDIDLRGPITNAMRMLANSNRNATVDSSNSKDGTSSNSEKKIVNIMVFYSDNSFDSFLPASK